MTLLLEDPKAEWPKGEYIVLQPNGEAEADALRHLGMFCVQHGWGAMMVVSGASGEITESLTIIPKAAKPKAKP